jgi:hypothetical protein
LQISPVTTEAEALAEIAEDAPSSVTQPEDTATSGTETAEPSADASPTETTES